jgi:hypothetical protein
MLAVYGLSTSPSAALSSTGHRDHAPRRSPRPVTDAPAWADVSSASSSPSSSPAAEPPAPSASHPATTVPGPLYRAAGIKDVANATAAEWNPNQSAAHRSLEHPASPAATATDPAIPCPSARIELLR